MEIVKRLRRAGWDAAWVSAFRCGERRWGSYRLTPARLPPHVRDLEERIGRSPSGRPDVVAWKSERVAYIESKGPRDRLKSTQIDWFRAAIAAETGDLAIVEWRAAL